MLEGDLSDFTLPEILKLLAFTSKTGRLHLRRDDMLGRVEVGAGRVQAASADAAHLPLARRLVGRGLLDTDTLQELIGAREALPTDLELAHALVDADPATAPSVAEAMRAQSVDAVFDLLRWTEGHFRFAAEDVPTTGPLAVEQDLDELLELAQARLERWADIHERTGPGEASVSVTSPADPSVAIDADAWQLIGLADGSRTIDDLAGLTGRGQFDTRSTLVELADRGLVAFGTEQRDGALERLLRAQATLGELEQRLGTPDDAGAPRADTDALQPGADATSPSGDDAADPIEDQDADTLVADLDLDVPEEPGEARDAADDHADAHNPDADQTHGDQTHGDQADADRYDADRPDLDAPSDESAAEEPAARTNGIAPPVGANGDTPRTVGRRQRLRTDPTVDPALVDRLIDGVRNLA
jgi:hypothetical protein